MRFVFWSVLAALASPLLSGGAVLHISPRGSDDAEGTAEAPIRSLERLHALLTGRPDTAEVIFHDGTYYGSLELPAMPGEDMPPHLVLRAAEGATPILDGAAPLPADQAASVEGMANVYRFDESTFRSEEHRQRGLMPPLWDEAVRTRYALVADARAVERVPGSYTFSGGFLYLHTTDGRHPARHSIEVGRLDAAWQGLLVRRSNVTVRGLTARNYSVDIHSAGFHMDSGAENVTFEGCRAFNCSRGFRVRGRHANVLDGFADDVGCGVLVNGDHVRVEGGVFLRGPRDGFMIPMPRQEDTGIEVYHPAGERVVIRGNTTQGFTYHGVFLKSRPGEYIVERNTVVGSWAGIGWDHFPGRRVLVRNNVMLGNVHAMTGPTDQARVYHRAYGNMAWPAPWVPTHRTIENVEYMNSVGEHNVLADPRLAAPEAGDFRLLPGSPALDRSGPGEHAGAHGPVPEGWRDEHPPLLDVSSQPDLAPVTDAEDGGLVFSADRREFSLRVRAHDSAGKASLVSLRTGDGPWGEAMPYAPNVPVRLPADEGDFEIRVRVADDSGHWSEPAAIRIHAAIATPQLVGKPTVRANRHGVVVSFRTNVPCRATGETGREGSAPVPMLRAGMTRPGEAGPARREHVLAMIRPEGAQEDDGHYRIQLATRDGGAGQEFLGTFRFEGEPAEYFVAPAGEDAEDAGTADAPWRTLQYAVDRALPGDRITVRPGLYTDGVRITRGGTEEAPLVVAASERWGAVLDGQRRVRNMVHLESAPHVVISGLEVRWYGDPEGVGIRLDNSSHVRVSECKIWNAFWFQGRAVGRGVWVDRSPEFTLERSLLFRQDWALILNLSPRARLEHNTFRSHVHGGLNFVESVAGTTLRNNCITYPGNFAYRFTVRERDETDTFDSDFNNLGTRLRHWRNEPGAAPNLGWSWGGSKCIIEYRRRGGSFIRADRDAPTYHEMAATTGLDFPLRRDIHAPDEEGWEGPPGQRFMFLPHDTTPEEERGCPFLIVTTFEDWQEFYGLDPHSIFADPRHKDILEFDFRLLPDSPNIGAGENGTTIGAMGVAELE